MDFLKPKIELYVKRTFDQKMNATFDFIKENWKVLLKYITYFMLPICFISSLSMTKMMTGMLDMNMNDPNSLSDTAALGLGIHYGTLILVMLIGYVLIVSLVYAFMRLYGDREDRLVGVTIKDLKPYLFHNIKRTIIMSLIFIVVLTAGILVIVLTAFITPFLLILTIPAGIVAMIPLTLITPAYLLEDISFGTAFVKAYRLGFRTMGGIIALAFILGIIAYIVQLVLAIPWYALFMTKVILGIQTGSHFNMTGIYVFFTYLSAVVMNFGQFLSIPITLIGFGYQFGHASEKIDHVKTKDDIDHFDTL